MTDAQAAPHRVVIVGAGFGGLRRPIKLKGAPVRITLIDRRNHHLFQPLLYQVATASLATVRDRLADPLSDARPAGGHDPARQRASASTRPASACCSRTATTVPYDTLVLATGARHAYFGHDEWEPFAPGLKTLEDATTMRRRMLRRLRAGGARDRSRRARGAPDLRHHRRRADRGRARRHHRRAGARHPAPRLPQHRHPKRRASS